MECSSDNIALIVPARHVKTVKSALERTGKLDRTSKISAEAAPQESKVSEEENNSNEYHSKIPLSQESSATEKWMRIPTTLAFSVETEKSEFSAYNRSLEQFKAELLQELGIELLSHEIKIVHHAPPNTIRGHTERSPLRKALREALESFPELTLSALQLTITVLVNDFTESYSIYSPMLLLPHNAFNSRSWQTLLSAHPPESAVLNLLWAHIASALGVTHVAINSPIPLSKNNNASTAGEENILRSPLNITPLYNSFGPPPNPQTISSPTQADFDAGFWVSTIQNGIHQTWAPLYTMFSRGNIREKTRILHLPSVTSTFDVPSAAVDLYAGIGYFAFSYKKGGSRRSQAQPGIDTVVCFELNPWSVEGLRRGAIMNGWTTRIFTEADISSVSADEGVVEKVDFVIFQTSNERALKILSLPKFRRMDRPVRHVNLGLLPTSRLAWETAARLIDLQRGGWVHVHENVGAGDIEQKKLDIETKFLELVRQHGEGMRTNVAVEHVERVKLYAPGVYHCVFDIHIDVTAKNQ